MRPITRRQFTSLLAAGAVAGQHPSVVSAAQINDLTELAGRITSLARNNSALYLANGLTRQQDTTLLFENFNNLVIQGAPTRLALLGRQPPLRFQNCKNISLTDIELDWKTPGLTQGEVVDSSQDQKQIVLRIMEDCHVPMSGEVFSLFSFDRETHAPTAGFREIGGSHLLSSKPLSDRLVELSLDVPFTAPPTAIIFMKLRGPTAPALIFESCEDVLLDRIRIRRAPQMGISVRRCSNIKISNTEIGTEGGSAAIVSIGADGIHFISCRGEVEISNCKLSGLGDDCVNIHEFYYAVEQVDAENWITIAPETSFELQRTTADYFLPRLGDTIEIVDRSSQNAVETRKVIAVNEQGGRPRIKLSGSILTDATRFPALLCRTPSDLQISINQSSFSRTRARGILVHSQARIAECTFDNIGYAGVFAAADGRSWGEGCSVANIQIDNNLFMRCGLYGAGAIEVETALKSATSAAPKDLAFAASGGVTITRNRIAECRGPGVKVRSRVPVKIQHNFFDGSSEQDNPALDLQQTERAEVTSNVSVLPSAVVADSITVKHLKMGDNKGLPLRTTRTGR